VALRKPDRPREDTARAGGWQHVHVATEVIAINPFNLLLEYAAQEFRAGTKTSLRDFLAGESDGSDGDDE
jgi:hypothetical protein